MAELTEKREMPPSVHVASGLTLILAVCALATAGPACILGLILGPHILILALAYAALAPVLFLSQRGLVHRRRWARRLLIVLSAVTAAALTIAIVGALIGNVIGLTTGASGLLVSFCCALITLKLSSSAAKTWCTKTDMRVARVRLTVRSMMVVIAVAAIISWGCIIFWRALPGMIVSHEGTLPAAPLEDEPHAMAGGTAESADSTRRKETAKPRNASQTGHEN